MIRILYRSAIRLILRNPILSTVKISGLAIGSAIFLLTCLFCLHEMDYDKQHPDFNRIYRYVHVVNSSDGIQRFAFTSATTGPALVERYPFVKAYCRLIFPLVSVRNPESDQSFNERKFAFADRNLFDFFGFPLAGEADPKTVLDDPMEVIITPAAARKYFNTEMPVGKTLMINGDLIFTISGVLKEQPAKSHIDFDFVASFSSLEVIKHHPVISQQIPASLNLEAKGFSAFYTYLLLASESSATKLIELFPSFIEDFRGKGRSERLKPTLQRMQSIHLQSDLLYEINPNGSMRRVTVYFFCGLLILVIACINYINISTAEFLDRAPGLGLKKILGISRSSLIAGHLAETSILAIVSIVIGSICAFLAMPAFNALVNRDISFLRPETAEIALVIFAVVVVVSGMYPALHITRSPALETFKGSFQGKPASYSLRNALVFFQLLSSFCLLFFSLLTYQQLEYLSHKDPGFDARQVLMINASTAPPGSRITFKHRLLSVNHVVKVAMCSTPPGESFFSYGITLPENSHEEERRVGVYQSYVDADYAQAMGIDLTAGRFFDEASASDSAKYVIVNAAAANALGGNVLQREIELPGMLSAERVTKNVVGVVNDFNFASPHEEVQPLLLEYDPRRCRYILVRIDTRSASEVVAALGRTWKEVMPALPFDYSFLDQKFQLFFVDDEHEKLAFTYLAVLAVGLASMGIFGSTLFLVQRKTREVSIRKVLGSERLPLMLMLFKPTFLLLIVSCVVGIPLASIYGDQWLSQYAYHITVSPMLYIVAFFTMAVVVSATVSYHFLKVTNVNPAEILKREG